MAQTNQKGSWMKPAFYLLCIAACAVICVLNLIGADSTMLIKINSVLRIVALLMAACYIVSGYVKSAAGFYKAYGAIVALIYGIALAGVIMDKKDVLSVAVIALPFVGLLVMLFGRNLGKKLSMGLCYGMLALTALELILTIANGYSFALTGIVLVRGILLGVYTLMTHAKYLDKAARGTK